MADHRPLFFVSTMYSSIHRFIHHLCKDLPKDPRSILLRTTFQDTNFYLLIQLKRGRLDPGWAGRVWAFAQPKTQPKSLVILETPKISKLKGEKPYQSLVHRLCHYLGCRSHEEAEKFRADIGKYRDLFGISSLLFTKDSKYVLLIKTDRANVLQEIQGKGESTYLGNWPSFFTKWRTTHPADPHLPILKWKGEADLGTKGEFSFDLVTADQSQTAGLFTRAIRDEPRLANAIFEAEGYTSLALRQLVVHALSTDESMTPLLASFVARLEGFSQMEILKQAVIGFRLSIIQFFVKHGLAPGNTNVLHPISLDPDDYSLVNGIILGLADVLRRDHGPKVRDFIKRLFPVLPRGSWAIACHMLPFVYQSVDLFSYLLDKCHYPSPKGLRMLMHDARHNGASREILAIIQKAIDERIKPPQAWGA